MTRRVFRRGVVVLSCTFMLAFALLHSARSVARAEEPIRVYVFAGQSNMVGKDTLASDLPRIAPSAMVPSPSVQFWGPIADFPTSWGPLRAPTEIVQPRTHQGFGPEIGAGPLLARMHPDSTIAIVKFASSGTSLYRDWNPNRPDGLYPQMIERVRSAIANLRSSGTRAPVRLAGFFWMQGEADSDRLKQARNYEANLEAFVRAVRKDLRAPSLPFVFGRIADLRRESTAHFQYSNIVRSGQGEVARTVPNTFMVSTDDLERSPAQRIHFSSRGTYELGRSFVRPSYGL
jgi:hypothetical protein